MKICLLLVLVFVFSSFKTTAHAQLKDPIYSFDQSKVDAAPNSFHFLRSFVDLFYLTIKANPEQFPTVVQLSNTSGWCLGDVHPENFGMLIDKNNNAIFTMNDVDDSGPCPVIYDLFRLMVSSKLQNENIDLSILQDAYVDGLKGNLNQKPDILKTLKIKSEERGSTTHRNKVKDNLIVRNTLSRSLESSEQLAVIKALQHYSWSKNPTTKIIDLVASSKLGGGSAGLLRYEVLIEIDGKQVHLELKQLTQPAIYPVATSNDILENPIQRVSKALSITQGDDLSSFYNVFKIKQDYFIMRPRFWGNITIDLVKNSKEENTDIINYEAYILGTLHSKSILDINKWTQTMFSLKNKKLKNEAELIANYFNQQYKKLKSSEQKDF